MGPVNCCWTEANWSPVLLVSVSIRVDSALSPLARAVCSLVIAAALAVAFAVVDELPRNPALKVSLPAVAALYEKR